MRLSTTSSLYRQPVPRRLASSVGDVLIGSTWEQSGRGARSRELTSATSARSMLICSIRSVLLAMFALTTAISAAAPESTQLAWQRRSQPLVNSRRFSETANSRSPAARTTRHRDGIERCGCAAGRTGSAHRQEARPQTGRHAAAPDRPDPPPRLPRRVGGEAARRDRDIEAAGSRRHNEPDERNCDRAEIIRAVDISQDGRLTGHRNALRRTERVCEGHSAAWTTW